MSAPGRALRGGQQQRQLPFREHHVRLLPGRPVHPHPGPHPAPVISTALRVGDVQELSPAKKLRCTNFTPDSTRPLS
jgi:hypothetical protein